MKGPDMKSWKIEIWPRCYVYVSFFDIDILTLVLLTHMTFLLFLHPNVYQAWNIEPVYSKYLHSAEAEKLCSTKTVFWQGSGAYNSKASWSVIVWTHKEHIYEKKFAKKWSDLSFFPQKVLGISPRASVAPSGRNLAVPCRAITHALPEPESLRIVNPAHPQPQLTMKPGRYNKQLISYRL